MPAKKPAKKVTKKPAAKKPAAKRAPKKVAVKPQPVTWQSLIPFRKLNRVLLVLIIAINAYTLGAPYLPRLDYLWRQHTNHNAGMPYQSKLAPADKPSAPAATPAPAPAPIPQDNRLVIPKITLDQAVLQGSSAYTVNRGVWARPQASTPPDGGNTVLVGHRYTYSGPAVFYNLDKLAVGDKIIMYWQGQEYDYAVSSTKVVEATDLAVESPTAAPRLTLYTCTPLFSFTQRLVIVANPIKESAQ